METLSEQEVTNAVTQLIRRFTGESEQQQYSYIKSTLFPQHDLHFSKLFLSLGHFRIISVSTGGLTVCV